MKINKITDKGIILFKKIHKSNIRRNILQSKIITVPYYSQWESKELVKEILNRKLDARKDPKWKNSGAKDLKEYLHWSWNTCGMACLKMILESKGVKSPPIVDLGKGCMQYGGYKINKDAFDKDDYNHSIDGLYYKPFITFIKNEFGIDSTIISPLILEEILKNISKNNLVIASVSPRIRIPSDNPVQKGGHLILVTGYDLTSQNLFIHNPSGLPDESQENAKITFKEFEMFFGHRGIIIK